MDPKVPPLYRTVGASQIVLGPKVPALYCIVEALHRTVYSIVAYCRTEDALYRTVKALYRIVVAGTTL